VATTTFSGANGPYHWQARAIDAQNNTSTWQTFSTTAPSGTQELYNTPLYTDANLVSYYRLEGNGSDQKSAHNGTPSNVTFGTSYGKFGQGGSFNGSNSSIALANSMGLSNTALTLTGWVKPNSFGSPTYGRLISLGNSTDNLIIDMNTGGNIQANYYKGSNIMTINTSGYSTGQWYFVAYVQNGNNQYLYVNGTLVGSSWTTLPTASPWTSNYIGWDGGGAYLNGSVDDAAIFSRALTATEVSELYTGNWPPTNNATSTDFVLAAPHINFTFPTQGTTTANFSNWQLKADTVTSTDSYALTVNWDDTLGDPVQSSTINASGTSLLAGVNVPKPTSSLDYTYDGTPVLINATATLMDATTTTATSSVGFTEITLPNPANCGAKTIQCISYLYDNDGNITQINDQSAASSSITVKYTYDNLNRLLSASSTNAATGQNYAYAYTYDPVGNILSSPYGAYTYAGSGYPDTDAVTKVVNGSSTINLSYDNDGNLISGSGTAYTWDYRSELLTASSTNGISTYGYDYTGARMKSVNGTSTIYDPETTYSVTGVTSTTNIYLNGALFATIVGTGVSSTVYTNLTDPLGSSNVSAGPTGAVSQVLSYYPYGAIRLNQQAGSFNQRRQYIGQVYDAATLLSYLNSRYYSGMQGQFISEDPSFLATGNPNKVQQLTGQDQATLLSNPQQLNVYSYSQNNPIINSDPSGNWYIAINFTGLLPIPYLPGLGVGATFGLQISQEGIYGYSGPAAGTLPPSASVGFSTANPSTGWSTAVSGCLILCYGKSLGNNGQAGEWSIGSPNLGVSRVQTVQLLSFGSAVYNIYPSQTQNNQSLQNTNRTFSSTAKTIKPNTLQSGSTASSGSGGFNIGQQNRTATYTFNGGVNAYGQTYSQVFSH